MGDVENGVLVSSTRVVIPVQVPGVVEGPSLCHNCPIFLRTAYMCVKWPLFGRIKLFCCTAAFT